MSEIVGNWSTLPPNSEGGFTQIECIIRIDGHQEEFLDTSSNFRFELMVKRRGPKQEPWGIPHFASLALSTDRSESRTIFHF